MIIHHKENDDVFGKMLLISNERTIIKKNK